MSAGTKLAAFAVGAALAFGAGAAVGAAVGPIDTSRDDGHDRHHGHVVDTEPPASSVATTVVESIVTHEH